MDFQEFIRELRKSPRKWEIIKWPDACHAIRLDNYFGPLTFVCAQITKTTDTGYGIADWDMAADELGIDSKLAKQIQDASDFAMKNLNAAKKRIRTQLLEATGLSSRHKRNMRRKNTQRIPTWKELEKRAKKMEPFIMGARVMELGNLTLDEKSPLKEISRHIEHLKRSKRDLEAQHAKDRAKNIRKANLSLLKELSQDIKRWSNLLAKKSKNG